MPGMVLVQVGERKISSASEAVEALSAAKAGSALLLRLRAPNSDATVLRAVEIPER